MHNVFCHIMHNLANAIEESVADAYMLASLPIRCPTSGLRAEKRPNALKNNSHWSAHKSLSVVVPAGAVAVNQLVMLCLL